MPPRWRIPLSTKLLSPGASQRLLALGLGLQVTEPVFETAVVLLLRAHYTMDVFAGLMTALYVAGIAAWLALPCDRALAAAFQ